MQLDSTAPGALVACDRRQMVSAIANLLDNAVKYSEPGSRVSLAASVALQHLVITVRDEGIGIPSRDLERIFERFYRVDHARSRDTGGTGLGLAIVRHVVQAHGGEVAVESVEGQGSTFRLVATARLGRHRATRVSREPIVAEAPLILVVDDEQSYRDALRVALEREGFRVEVAVDGPDALERFDAVRPGLVLLDVMLPRISGVDVCRQIRAKSKVPIIMVTARNAEIDAVVGLEVGADDYVTKPFRLRELVARVRAALRRGRPDDSGLEDYADVIEVGDVRLDAARHEVAVRGETGRACRSRSSSCSSSCSRTPGGCSPATCSSTVCGAPITTATPRRSTCT